MIKLLQNNNNNIKINNNIIKWNIFWEKHI